MKKTVILITVFIAIFMIFANIPTNIYATDAVADDEAESQLIEIKETQTETLEEYKEKYGSDAYGLTAYILHIFQVYSIPFCFLGIVISIIYKVIIGMRNLENAEKGLGMIIAIVTLTIICQVLPLVFAVVVKLGKE